jgi:GNAT superfamily N-acetyltransferase
LSVIESERQLFVEEFMQLARPEVTESVFQYISVWKVLAGDRPDADLGDRQGLSMCWADSLFPFWNAVFVTDPLADAPLIANRLREAADYMRQKQQRGLVYVCEDYLDTAARQALGESATQAGLVSMMEICGMAGDMLPYDAALLEAPLEFRRVSDEAALLTYGEINARGYGFTLEAGREALAGSRFWRSTAYSFIGYLDGRAVSTAAVIVNGGRLYLALVATLPDAQRKGYGIATVRHALQQAYCATGLTRAVLHASPAGLPVYLRAGFQITARFLTYGLTDRLD